jgi:hypothetical protein
MAVVALIWANLGLWHARRTLKRSRQSALMMAPPSSPAVLVPSILTPPALAELTLAPAVVTHPTSPVLAS